MMGFPGMTFEDWHRRYQQQSQWTQVIRRYLFTKSGLKPDDKVLEIGSGTGAILEQLLYDGHRKLFGIDINHHVLQFAKQHTSSLILAQSDGYRLPFLQGSFSATYCHFLLLWVSHPVKILTEMCRVTKPGGFVIALAEPDYEARIDYPPPLDWLGEQQTLALQTQGIDINTGRQLGQYFHEAGLLRIETGILGARWELEQENTTEDSEWTMLRADLNGVVSDAQIQQYQEFDRKARQDGSRVLFIPTFYALGQVKP